MTPSVQCEFWVVGAKAPINSKPIHLHPSLVPSVGERVDFGGVPFVIRRRSLSFVEQEKEVRVIGSDNHNQFTQQELVTVVTCRLEVYRP